MKELHEGPKGRHFATEITRGRYWMLNISGLLCTKMCTITTVLTNRISPQVQT